MKYLKHSRFVSRFALLATLMLSSTMASTPAFADTHADNSYARLWEFNIQPGKMGQFMEAFAAHIAWRKANGDSWTWVTHMPVTGEQFNTVWVRSGEHALADMDAYDASEFGQKANQHWGETVDPVVAGYKSWITKTDEDLSAWPEDMRPGLISATTFKVKRGMSSSMDATLKQIHAGLQEAEWSEPYAISRVFSGAAGNEITVVSPYMNLADMAEPEVSFMQALSQSVGEEKAKQLVQDFNDAVANESEVLVRIEPELSLFQEN